MPTVVGEMMPLRLAWDCSSPWVTWVGGGHDESVRPLADRRLDGRDLRGGRGLGAAGFGAGGAEGTQRGERPAGLHAVGGGEVGVAEVLGDDEDLQALLQPARCRGRG